MEYRPTSSTASPFETLFIERDVSSTTSGFSTTLDGLTPSTEYDVRVRGENAVGRSVPSATMQTNTEDNGELSSLVVVEELLKMLFCL